MALATQERFSNRENQHEADIPEIRLVLPLANLPPANRADEDRLMYQRRSAARVNNSSWRC